VDTKWYTANGSTFSDMSKCWLQLDFADPQPVTAYAWATADDRWYGRNASDTRDPAKFCLLGSDDGNTWEKIGWRDVGSIYIAAKTWTGPYAIGAHYGATSLLGGVLEVRKDVEFASVAQCGGNVRIAEGCAMTLANGGVWVGPKFTSDSRGAVNSSSSSANYMHVAATEFTGDLNVKSGTLTFKKGVSDRIFRLELKRVYSASANCVQLSRLMIYDESRNNLALGLVEAAAGTLPSELAPGTCAYGDEYVQGWTSSVTNLFDGKTSTKMCLAELAKGQEFSRVIYFRLPASATSAACSYQFTTADDNTPARNPSLWTLESSADGVTWNTIDTRTSGEFTNPTQTYTDFNGGTPMLFRSVSGTVSFASGACVSVASGATLNFGDVQCEISGLRIDCATGIGAMSNFSPAESGVLLLENVPAGTSLRSYTIPFSPGTTSNVGNLRSWGVYVNGAKVNYRAQLAEGAIKFVSCGFMLIVK
jgi:hypothetical protein